MSKAIHSWRDLDRYGIKALTGEADKYGLRILCDLTQEGKTLLENFFSVKALDTMDNWNSEAIGNILLPYSILIDLATFCLFRRDNFYAVAITKNESVQGLTKERYKKYEEAPMLNEFGIRTYRNLGYREDLFTGELYPDRNEHQFTGRKV